MTDFPTMTEKRQLRQFCRLRSPQRIFADKIWLRDIRRSSKIKAERRGTRTWADLSREEQAMYLRARARIRWTSQLGFTRHRWHYRCTPEAA